MTHRVLIDHIMMGGHSGIALSNIPKYICDSKPALFKDIIYEFIDLYFTVSLCHFDLKV